MYACNLEIYVLVVTVGSVHAKCQCPNGLAVHHSPFHDSCFNLACQLINQNTKEGSYCDK